MAILGTRSPTVMLWQFRQHASFVMLANASNTGL